MDEVRAGGYSRENKMKTITLEDINVKVTTVEVVTLENVDVKAVQKHYLDTVVKQVQAGTLGLVKPREVGYCLIKNGKVIPVNL